MARGEKNTRVGFQVARALMLRGGTDDVSRTLSGNLTLTIADGNYLFLDPGGSARTLTLPAEKTSRGMFYVISNEASAAGEDLTVNNDGSTTITTIEQGGWSHLHCDGTTWREASTNAATSSAAVGGSVGERVVFYDDFLLASSGTLPAPLGKDMQTANIAGDYTNDAAGGTYTITHDGTSEAQAGQLTFADQLVIDITKNPVMECRCKINFAGATFSADQRFVCGLASAHANAEDALDSVATHAWFRVEGASLNILVEADDGTTDTDDQDSTIDIVDDTYVTFKIDASDLSDVKFYVDGTEQGGATVAIAAATGNVQPIVCIQRDAGTEAEVVTIDYLHVSWDR